MIAYALGCVSPLGMEDNRINDTQIMASSVRVNSTANGTHARLRQNITQWGAWCPDVSGGSRTELNYDQYIQIDLLTLTKISRIATQGREHAGGKEWVKYFQISYSRNDGVWNFYQGKTQTEKACFCTKCIHV